MDVREHGNGASLVRAWDAIFRRRNAMKNVVRARAGGYLSIQASCGSRALLAKAEATGGNRSFRSFLVRHNDPAIFEYEQDPSPEYLTDAELGCYMERYPDLTASFSNSSSGKTLAQLMRYHWRTAGRAEGRNPLRDGTRCTPGSAAAPAVSQTKAPDAEILAGAQHESLARNHETGLQGVPLPSSPASGHGQLRSQQQKCFACPDAPSPWLSKKGRSCSSAPSLLNQTCRHKPKWVRSPVPSQTRTSLLPWF